MSKTYSARLGGAAALFALGLSVAAPGFAFAQAEGEAGAGGEGPVAAQSFSNDQIESLIASVPENGNSTFTIHKFLGDPQPKDRLTGTSADAPTGNDLKPAAGVEFSVQKVEGIDLGKREGWEKYSKLDAAQAPPNLGAPKTLTTNDQGVASDTFEVGVYYVTETKTPEGSPAIAPFYVALPLPDSRSSEDGTVAWNQDVHVYPKNQSISVEKAVIDRDTAAGKTVDYTIKADVPAVPAEGKFKGYTLFDDYDETRVTPDFDTVKVTAGSTELAAEDYTVEKGTGDFKVVLTESGLDKLAKARNAGGAATKATLEFTADVKNDAAEGEAPNKAKVIIPNNGGGKGTTDVDSNEVKTVFGKININKTDSENGKALEGAEFQLYKCANGTTNILNDTPLTVAGTDTWKTDAEGKVTLPVIQVEDFYNNASQDDEFDYCLVESKAPSGYALNPEPISASVTNMERVANVEVKNVPDDGMFNLPTTGLAGSVGLIAIGGALATAAGVRKVRKDSAAA